ncbi:hypothetical protein [Streptomyces collinus]|uniref:hypothetical protein n=1 Tax=Streptomyces collinus TaxID=42684 RepID=UPI0036D04D0F
MADLKNIALTADAARVLNKIAEQFPVTNRVDLARLGFAYAVRSGVELNSDLGKGSREGGANYNSATFDPDGKMSEVVRVFFADDPRSGEPYRAIESLSNSGLILLGRHLDEGLIGSISDLIPQGPQPAGPEAVEPAEGSGGVLAR